ncbi:N-acetylmuramoyl-L-alanine amidase [Kamptonema cortianum]|nr:N-acetylmuramoyl-L-alanine amidase [Geitlerinema splendidum]MDK3156176.1 N-acetylmuramoyl-L-alanine amidase [Kamptonema cortianum]
MRNWLTCLVPWMAVTVAYAVQPAAVNVQYAYQGTFKQDVFKIGDDCVVEPRLAKSWGWNVDVRGDEFQIACEARLFRIPIVRHNGRILVNLNESARFLGTTATWDGDTFRMLGKVRNIEATAEGLRVDSMIKVSPRVFKLQNPDRLVIDLTGAHLDTQQTQTLPSWWRVAQFAPDIVRIVIEHPGAVAYPIKTIEPGRSLDFTFPEVLRQDPASITGPIRPAQDSTSNEKRILLKSPEVLTQDDRALHFKIPAAVALVKGPAVQYLSPTRLQLSVSGAVFEAEDAEALVKAKLVDSAMITSDGAAAVLIIDTARPLAFQVSSRGNAVFMRLFVPSGLSKSLSGRTIVIDPGHGGRDPGARNGEVTEKALALKISQALRDELSRLGASVIMTRDEDSYPSLGDRAQLANQSKADFFLSIHINATGKPNKASGAITFFHMQDPVDRLLAECIQAEISKVNNLPDLGAWSDGRIYNSGFKVLRDSTVPSVLIECGFIDHSKDRAEMTKPDFPERMAKAIAKGLKVYLGEKE